MSKTANLAWTDPAAPLTGIEVAYKKAADADFVVFATLAPGVQADSIPNLADGDYDFKVTVLNGTARSTGQVVSGTITSDAVPGEVSGLTVSFS